jgi:aconitate hydratase
LSRHLIESKSSFTPLDSFAVCRRVNIGGRRAQMMSLAALGERFPSVQRLPIGLKIVLENLLRHEDGESVTADHIAAVAERTRRWGETAEISFQPTRIVMQDYSGLVALIDIATIRDRFAELGGDPARINPVKPAVLIVDHSLMVNHAGTKDALERNLAEEYEQNRERYEFLKWAQGAFTNLRIVPPGNGIIHQVNLERLAEVVSRDGSDFVFPETQIGTDSHTTMINGLGVLGWGVGGIEAEAAMLGEPVSMLVPDVIGVRLSGEKRAGVLSTDLVLSITEKLRKVGVVDRFVEFFGPGVNALSAGDRATIANMAPEYGATCGLFPVDAETLRYLSLTGRSAEHVAQIGDYARASGLWNDEDRDYAQVVEIDLGSITLSVAGPRRPHDRLDVSDVARTIPAAQAGSPGGLADGDVVIAAITSCTNTSNAHAMIAAGLLARNAVARGLRVSPHVKTTLSPGSRTVARYLSQGGLLEPLAKLGFDIVGFGCATCVGNSGPLNDGIQAAIKAGSLSAASVLSGNRNFEGRIHPSVKLNYLASPPLVVAYALAGTMKRDLDSEPLGFDRAGVAVMLRELWPSDSEIDAFVRRHVTADAYQASSDIYSGGPRWTELRTESGQCFDWRSGSTYVGPSPFIAASKRALSITGAAPLLLLGDNVTTDHISPVGPIPGEGPAADFLRERGIARGDFNAFGARRGNAEVMTRGTFANPRLKNELVPVEGPFSIGPSGAVMPIFDAAEAYRREGTPLAIVAGQNYGAGSARDWAAKGTFSLGVRAVIAESFERIHRANLVLMGVLVLQLVPPVKKSSFSIDAHSRITIALPETLAPRQRVEIAIDHPAHGRNTVEALARIDTREEVNYFLEGGVLPAVTNRLSANAGTG